jgi:hypothetical protein
MATTTGGTTYVTSTDLVANYPTASLALANRVDVVASGGPGLVKTSGYTITVADILGGNKFLYNSASPGTFTLPTSSLVDGMVVNVAQIGSAALTVSGGTIVGTTVTTAQYQGLSFVYVASGATWYSIAPNVTPPGLATAIPTSIANSGGTATLTGGTVTVSGVTSVSLNGVFTSAYENYAMILQMYGSTDNNVALRMRLSGTDATTNYNSQRFDVDSSVFSASRSTAQTNLLLANVYRTSTNPNLWRGTIGSPNLARFTTFEATALDVGSSGVDVIYRGLVANHSTATAYDGCTLSTVSGNMTGTIRIYGYKNS